MRVLASSSVAVPGARVTAGGEDPGGGVRRTGGSVLRVGRSDAACLAPRPDGTVAERPNVPLATLAPGQGGQIMEGAISEAAQAFLAERGLRPGREVRVAAAGEGGVLVEVDGEHVALSRDLAAQIAVREE